MIKSAKKHINSGTQGSANPNKEVLSFPDFLSSRLIAFSECRTVSNT
jgi:hypothetical protein